MPSLRLLAALALLASLLLTGCGADQSREIAYRDTRITALEEQVSDLLADLAAKEAELAQLRSRPVQPQQDLTSDLAGTGAEWAWRHGELVISISNEILFTAGSANLTAGAKNSLRQVAQVIRSKYPDQYVRVEGHTDSDPIRRTRDKWEDNWHLSGARARAVLHELIERNNLSAESTSFAGYAFTRPRAENTSTAGKARNRRVEIVVLPKRP